MKIFIKPKISILLMAVLPLTAMLSGCRSAQTGLSSAAVTCDRPCESASPKIVFAETEHNFGTVQAGAEQSCTFDFINDGGQDLVIERIHASCGCATTIAESKVIKPGQASEISVKYQAGYAGKARKQIVVYTNDPEHPQTTLWVTAEIKGSPRRPQNFASTTSSSEPEEKQPPKDTMPPRLKQALRNLNQATGG